MGVQNVGNGWYLQYVYDFEVEIGLGTKGTPNGCDPLDSCGGGGFVVLRLSKDLR